jgi:hypothetical protein
MEPASPLRLISRAVTHSHFTGALVTPVRGGASGESSALRAQQSDSTPARADSAAENGHSVPLSASRRPLTGKKRANWTPERRAAEAERAR